MEFFTLVTLLGFFVVALLTIIVCTFGSSFIITSHGGALHRTCTNTLEFLAPHQEADAKMFLVIAHPDDEAMFFVPIVAAIFRNTTCRRNIHVVCLSSGDFEGLGQQRKEELFLSCRHLGIATENVCVIDDVRLRDGMKEEWDSAVIANHVQSYVQSKRPACAIFLTFDNYGISGHPNHIAVNSGIKLLIAQHAAHQKSGDTYSCTHVGGKTSLSANTEGCPKNITFVAYALSSESLLFKYSGVFGIAFTMLRCNVLMKSLIFTLLDTLHLHAPGTQKWTTSASVKGREGSSILDAPDIVTFVHCDPLLVNKCMCAHASQYVWFRKLFVMFSSYTYTCQIKSVM